MVTEQSLMQVLTQAAWSLTTIIDGFPEGVEALSAAQGLQAILKQLSLLAAGTSEATQASTEASAAINALLTTLSLLLSQQRDAPDSFCEEVRQTKACQHK